MYHSSIRTVEVLLEGGKSKIDDECDSQAAARDDGLAGQHVGIENDAVPPVRGYSFYGDVAFAPGYRLQKAI
jgi:hypothetical protein